jgi:hypothetical protein
VDLQLVVHFGHSAHPFDPTEEWVELIGEDVSPQNDATIGDIGVNGPGMADHSADG